MNGSPNMRGRKCRLGGDTLLYPCKAFGADFEGKTS
jgi:hypothetical protein